MLFRSGTTLDIKTDEPIKLTIPSSGSFDDDFLYVARTGFTAKLSIDELGSWRFTGFLRSRQDNGGDFWDILDWRNIEARTALSSLGSITAATTLTAHGNIVFDGAAASKTMAVNPVATFNDKVNIAYLRLTNQAELYNAVTSPVEVTYGTYYSRYGTNGGEKLYSYRIGAIVHIFGWCERSSTTASGSNIIATGLPAPVYDTVAPVRSSDAAFCDSVTMATDGKLYGNHTTSTGNTPDLMINMTYRVSGYDSFA